MTGRFRIIEPVFERGVARFGFELDALRFTETLEFAAGWQAGVPEGLAFRKLLDLTALVLGTSYFKLTAPTSIDVDMPLADRERALAIDVYENGLGEFYARNNLERFGRIRINAPPDERIIPPPVLGARALLPIGGGKDSLVSVALLEAAGIDFVPFAVNPRGPIVTSIERIGRPAVYVRRVLDPEMIRLSSEPGYLTGHVPSTAIISLIGALCCLLYACDRIVLSNERSASEGNTIHDGREVNHQYSKSLGFEERLADVLAEATGGALGYFSLLRPYSEAKIAKLFARTTRFDDVFSSCNRNFRYNGHDGPLWCGECPKCHFVFLILAPEMGKARVTGIFGGDLLENPANENSFRELTGLAGQKPWECVGEILEAAACLWVLSNRPEWADDAVVQALRPDLLTQYGEGRLQAAYADLMVDGTAHHVPPALLQQVPADAI